MLQQKEYYKIVVKDNETANVYKIYLDEYKDFQNNFEYVYHTKNGNIYQLHEIFDAGINMLIVDDDEHLYELLDDLREQGFCDTIEFNWVDGYGYEAYKAF